MPVAVYDCGNIETPLSSWSARIAAQSLAEGAASVTSEDTRGERKGLYAGSSTAVSLLPIKVGLEDADR